MILVHFSITAIKNRHLKISLLSLLIFCLNNLIAQTADTSAFSKNIIFLEVGGPGGYGSMNFERTILKHQKVTVNGRIGLSTVHLKNHLRKINPDVIIPFSIHACYGNAHKAEVGLGETFTYMNVVNFDNYETKRNSYFHTAVSLGYRYQPNHSGIFVRLAYTPVFERNISLRHWGALSLGYTF